ncbi:hypothetical protein GOBAR_AA13007 [Gossypium barbadense]|uniref:Uncharacterized protein n=1 Tax=Gossypium barbadense TaxID=3634 RepID=A0A2P5XWE3_GOSBA|nr:hypothetical protein GOBAR_AA13007 [Gossypium barbadense]
MVDGRCTSSPRRLYELQKGPISINDGWRPDVVHGRFWWPKSGLSPTWRRAVSWKKHNLEVQNGASGMGAAEQVEQVSGDGTVAESR